MTELKDIRLVALDLDDTTLCSDGSLADTTREAIFAAISVGIEVVVASGRAFNSLPKTVTEIPGIRYAITSNGAAAVKNPSGERIVSLVLKPDTVREIIDVFGEELLECFIDGQAYCDARYMREPVRFGCSEAYVEYVKTTRLPVDDMLCFIGENALRIDSIDVLCTDARHRAELWDKAAGIGEAYVTSSSHRLIEIADAGAGKGATLKKLCAQLGIPPEKTAAFGNGDNDADMLKLAGLGVAVKNATAGCIAAADMVCASNDECGVAEILNKIMKEKQ